MIKANKPPDQASLFLLSSGLIWLIVLVIPFICNLNLSRKFPLNNAASLPRLSLVAPTMGKKDGIFRMLDSVIYQAPRELLIVTELVVFVNAMPDTKVDTFIIEKYLEEKCASFHSLRFIKADQFFKTAEESAWAACAHATGEYLWIVGDKRIFLPEGLTQLAKFIDQPKTPCAYFNAVWHDSDGHNEALASTHLSASTATVTYKEFVQSNGINFMATNMGAWIYQRKFLDLAVWKNIITNCGPHFSHVATLLATMGSTDVTCHSVFLTILEAKAYHAGNSSEWDYYSKISGTYRFYAWSCGLVRQYQFLVDRGVYSYADIRRAMCSEGRLLSRQVDEIYKSFLAQIWLGLLFAHEKIKREECDEILSFLTKACPERMIVNGLLRKFYEDGSRAKPASLFRNFRRIQFSINLDHKALRFSSLVVGQIGDQFIRLHPRGYLISKVEDNNNFIVAYKLTDAPRQTEEWRLIDDPDLPSLREDIECLDDLFPINVPKGLPLGMRIRQGWLEYCKRIGLDIIAAKIILRMPKPLITYAWKRRF